MSFFNSIYDFIMSIIDYLGIYGPLLGCILILIESIVPILPLSVFITLNFISFGNIIGFIVSYIFTLMGCALSFYLFRHFLRNWFESHAREKKYIKKFMKLIEKTKLQNLVLIIALPFTPAFFYNIAAGLSRIPFKKYFISIALAKIFLVYFWGYVGVTFMEALKNPSSFIKVIIICLVAYILSTFVNKKFNIG